MVIDKDPQVLLNLLVDLPHLSIGLRVIGSGGIPFDVQQFVQVLYEVQVELGGSVMDDFLGNAMEFKDMVSIQPGHAVSTSPSNGLGCSQ